MSEYTRDEQIEIANTILHQMGGFGKLKCFVGINNQCALDAGVQFSFKGSRIMNKVKIELNSMDTYDIKFFKIPTLRANCSPKSLDKYFENIEKCNIPIAEFEGLYYDQLIETFEETTGLDIHF